MASGLFGALNALKSNILGGGGTGTTSIIPRNSAIEMADTSPTSALDVDPYQFTSLTYPRDLTNSMQYGHYIQFYINVQNKTTYKYAGYDDKGNEITIGVQRVETQKEDISLGGASPTEYHKMRYAGEDYGVGVASTRPSYASDLHERTNGTKLQSEAVSLSKTKRRRRYGVFATNPQTSRITDAISIYLPPNVQDNTLMNYTPAETAMLGYLAASGGAALEAIRANDMRELTKIGLATLGGTLWEMFKTMGGSILETVSGSEGGYDLLNKIYGRTTNPYMEVFFQSPQLRTFQYNFTFAPRNEDERDDVQKIIHMFRFHMAPELRSGHNMFMTLPSEFDIYYMYQAEDGRCSENDFYNKISTCALTACNVDYTPGGVNSHADGSPVKITMNLTFQEMDMITKQRVSEGF